MFLWVVRVINTSLGKGEESLPFIGVLDIFGERRVACDCFCKPAFTT